MITINLPPQIESKLAEFAAMQGQSESVIASRAIADFLEEMEDVHLAESRLAEKNPRLSLDAMRERLLGDTQ